MYTTLNRIREHKPCEDGWESLLKYLGKTKPDDEPLPLLTILDSNGLDYALWCFRAVEAFDKEKLLLAITYAREVEHLMPAKSKKSLDVFERYANGLATEKEFDDAAARAAAAAAARAAAVAAARAAARAASPVAAARAAAAAAHAAARAAAAAWEAAAAAAAAAAARATWEADVAWEAAAATDAWEAAAAAAAAAAARAAAAHSTIRTKQETQLRQLLEKTCTQP